MPSNPSGPWMDPKKQLRQAGHHLANEVVFVVFNIYDLYSWYIFDAYLMHIWCIFTWFTGDYDSP